MHVPVLGESKQTAPQSVDCGIVGGSDVTQPEKDAGEFYLAGSDDQLLDFITYGFPMGYLWPESNTVGVKISADAFPVQVAAFLDKEINLGGVTGPLMVPLFAHWCHK